ncbi:hypothetical protein GCM10027445_34500 [Amycolatopsis endophytica]|uniref:Uncharacterized protein n=1 Tax=Amycolatopsis endophytica TaxID=860233 RepID=A0A853B0C8_9PSEU|nr:hypothetical protein [Amycolatopsis endophytica]NYI88513.1 hypothetical protein [Amycolatopsis endophytica]
MGKNARRAGVVGLVLGASTALSAPGALAEEADPALAGSCEATLQGGSGQALTLDAGAPLNLPGVITVGTGSDSAPTGPGQRDPLLSLPVADLADALNVGDTPVVGDLATDQVCPGLQNTVNALSTATQSIAGGEQLDPPPPGDQETPPADENPAPGTPDPGTPAPGGPAPAPDTPVPGAEGGVVPVSFVPADFFAGSGLTAVTPPLDALIQPGAVAPAAPGLVPPPETEPPLVTQNSGTAEAMPESAAPARLPLIIAVFALALVAAALTRAWMRRA